MANFYYFDSSALVKLYIVEHGSQWVEEIVNTKDQNGDLLNLVTISKIGIVEVAAAIARSERLGSITTAQRLRLFNSFARDSQELFETLSLTDELVHLGSELTQRWPLRGYDAVHLASAIVLNEQLTSAGLGEIKFVSADKRLQQASRKEGLTTEDPQEHL